jgi:hypothetical protein
VETFGLKIHYRRLKIWSQSYTLIKLLEKFTFVGNKVTASGNKGQLEELFRAAHSFRGFKQLFWQIMLHNIKYKSSNQFDVYFRWVVYI